MWYIFGIQEKYAELTDQSNISIALLEELKDKEKKKKNYELNSLKLRIHSGL